MSFQERLWMGEFGDAYLARNRVQWRARIPFWQHVVDVTKCESSLEVGCSAGWNLMALRECGVSLITGIEINALAVKEARANNIPVIDSDGLICEWMSDSFDLVFTAGVLIHIPSYEIKRQMRAIVQASKRYVLAIEYEAHEEQEVEYRGHKQALWKRPFGRLYRELGLRDVEGGPAEGFDRCTYWLLEKA